MPSPFTPSALHNALLDIHTGQGQEERQHKLESNRRQKWQGREADLWRGRPESLRLGRALLAAAGH